MTSILSDQVTLLCPYPSGNGKQSTTVDLLDFNEQHQPVGQPSLTISNTQPTLILVTVNPSNPLEFKVTTIAPKPANINTVTVTATDDRTKLDGTAIPPFTLTVTLQSREDMSSLEEDPTKTPLVVVDEPDEA